MTFGEFDCDKDLSRNSFAVHNNNHVSRGDCEGEEVGGGGAGGPRTRRGQDKAERAH